MKGDCSGVKEMVQTRGFGVTADILGKLEKMFCHEYGTKRAAIRKGTRKLGFLK